MKNYWRWNMPMTEFKTSTDVVLILGANDVVNPAAKT